MYYETKKEKSFGFFHARNLATTDEQEFEKIQDQFIWEEYTEGKPVNIPGTIFAVFIIFIGIKLIAGKKQALGLEDKEAVIFEESKVEGENDGK